jgi:DNA-binding IclR family transcriptional regulator
MPVKSAERALELLALVAKKQDNGDEVTQASLRRDTGLPRSSLHALLTSLVDSRFLELAGESYSIGMRAYEVGNVYASGIDIVQVSRPVLSQLVQLHGHTANLAILDGREIVYLLKVDAPHPIRLVSAEGRRLPAHCTALGKVLLSKFDDDELDRLYRGQTLAKVTPDTIDSYDELLKQIGRIRKTGIGTEVGESTPNVRCWATCIQDSTGTAVAAISVSMIALRGNSTAATEIIEALHGASREISQSLVVRR